MKIIYTITLIFLTFSKIYAYQVKFIDTIEDVYHTIKNTPATDKSQILIAWDWDGVIGRIPTQADILDGFKWDTLLREGQKTAEILKKVNELPYIKQIVLTARGYHVLDRDEDTIQRTLDPTAENMLRLLKKHSCQNILWNPFRNQFLMGELDIQHKYYFRDGILFAGCEKGNVMHAFLDHIKVIESDSQKTIPHFEFSAFTDDQPDFINRYHTKMQEKICDSNMYLFCLIAENPEERLGTPDVDKKSHLP